MIRILIAEDMRMLRRALVELISMQPDIEVVAELDSGADIVARTEELQPDVAVLDIELPVLDGISAARELHRRGIGAKVLIITSLDQPNNLRRALEAHVRGFMLKDTEPERLADAIRAVARGEQVFDPQLALAALNTAECPLTPREVDVLRLAASGDDVEEIAASLHLSLGTVRNYLTTVVYKLDARNRVDAIRIARTSGWL
ncbi:response regulator transcription factor [Streptomyces sp. NBC_01218]|uniref:response regulator transcription factor n=1 Tax=unclassified Streptomyces TaxID=2593676 RepID=UPI0023B958EA|nr:MULTISPECIES: response regulator transcription factor [unclassified Streptomyces]WEH39069.1 response regulator transcription factor [Streptomyces sp. AM 2-1-1]WSQ50725.1 response regulator transcription factor [Streptomyces sp. NBC_01218]